jgi:hypothetical protein
LDVISKNEVHPEKSKSRTIVRVIPLWLLIVFLVESSLLPQSFCVL